MARLVRLILIVFTGVGIIITSEEAGCLPTAQNVTPEYPLRDVSGDGSISAYDMALILRYSAGFNIEISRRSPLGLAEAAPIDVSVPDSSGIPGDFVIIPIEVSDTTSAGIIGIDIELSYDPDILTAMDIITGGTLTSGWLVNNAIGNGQVFIKLASVTPLQGAGTLVKIKFKVSESASIDETSPLTLTNVSFNENIVPVNITNGTFIVCEELHQQIHLYRGWNLISICLDIADTSLLSVLDQIEGYYVSVWTYDASTRKWKYYIVGAGGMGNRLTDIKPGVGYWINMTEEKVLDITGKKIINTAIPLKEGWNLVGCDSLTSKPIADALSSIYGKHVSTWTYDNQIGWLRYVEGGDTNDLDRLDPGSGYWIYVLEDCIWDINSP